MWVVTLEAMTGQFGPRGHLVASGRPAASLWVPWVKKVQGLSSTLGTLRDSRGHQTLSLLRAWDSDDRESVVWSSSYPQSKRRADLGIWTGVIVNRKPCFTLLVDNEPSPP